MNMLSGVTFDTHRSVTVEDQDQVSAREVCCLKWWVGQAAQKRQGSLGGWPEEGITKEEVLFNFLHSLPFRSHFSKSWTCIWCISMYLVSRYFLFFFFFLNFILNLESHRGSAGGVYEIIYFCLIWKKTSGAWEGKWNVTDHSFVTDQGRRVSWFLDSQDVSFAQQKKISYQKVMKLQLIWAD